MQNEELKEQEAVNQIYDYAANLIVNEKKSKSETKQALIEEGIDEESIDAWNTWFVNFLSLTYNKNVKAISFINTDWDRMAIEGISEWKDARLQNNEKIYRAWFKETSKGRYLNQSPELFELLGFTR